MAERMKLSCQKCGEPMAEETDYTTERDETGHERVMRVVSSTCAVCRGKALGRRMDRIGRGDDNG